ncbi:hypothetical protein [Paracoccus shanxieyensis]|uniref:N-acetyltransferase n=1 Tax=Paracoccus shanxieyensis TaxID=2675752 RepID=A0A6L6IX29_9RHOB|nr:hypothetical protein [Paracoccus shanxieyensis]MTH65075.1 hypothetical protein [Paracoccus shanxieyensis]MTH88219.1 hypothetical protein [Paracoccus shanxieyensis]
MTCRSVVLEPVTRAVIADLIPRLRPVDRLELDLMGTGEAERDLERLAGQSRRSMAAYMSGELVCIFGIKAMGILSDVGCPWAMMTRQVDRPEVRRAFIANSGPVVDWLGQDVRRMWNLVAEENTTAIRWLKWLGFRFDGRAVTVQGHRLLHFEMETKDVR